MDKSRPIIWIIDGLGPGGAEQLMPTLLAGLIKSGYNIRVCALRIRHGNPIAEELTKLHVPVDLVLLKNLRAPTNLFRLIRYLRIHNPQLIHTQLEFSDILGTVAARLLGIPSISTLHTLDTPDERGITAIWRLRLRWFILRNFSTMIIAVSEKTRLHYLHWGRFSKNNVRTVYNGIDISRFHKADKNLQRQAIFQSLNLPVGQKIITTIAVLREPKGIQFMLEALPVILSKQTATHYLVVGDGPYIDTLKAIAKKLQIESHVTFAGRRTDIPDILSISDIFVLPTVKDALPTVLIEAMAAEVPIIACDVGGVPEIIKNDLNGVLVPPADPSSLAGACLQLLQNEKKAQHIVSTGSEIVKEQFDVNSQIEKLDQIYKEAYLDHAT